MPRFPDPRRLLDGPPVPLPPLLDRCSEAWWRARPRARALLLALLVVAVAALTSVRTFTSPWGAPTEVLVAARPLAAGAELQPGDVRRERWPARLVPDRASAERAGRLVAPLPAGAVLTTDHLGDAGVAAGLPAGTAAVVVPAELLPEVTAGVRIDLVGADLDGRGVPLAEGALVLREDGAHLWVAVPRARAADVAAAVASGSVVAVLLPP